MPFTATLDCSIVDVPVDASRNKSARGLRVRVHDSASEVCLDEVNDRPSRGGKALCSIQSLGWWHCRQRCTVPVINRDAYMHTQRLLKTLVTFAISTAVQRGRWPPRAMNAPGGRKRARVAQRRRLLPCWTSRPALTSCCGRDVVVSGGQAACKQPREQRAQSVVSV